jgi:RNA:NAD 2'-phosphotransferase (TPT1/KptA family)
MKYVKLFENFANEQVKDLTKDELAKIDYFYHATTKENLYKILSHGIKKDKLEKVVYLADSYENAARFLAIRGHMGNIVVFKIDASKLDKELLEESFDHSYDFFKCRAYVYNGDIGPDAIDIDDVMQY